MHIAKRFISSSLVGLAAILASAASAADSNEAAEDQAAEVESREVARLLEGKLIIGGSTFQRIAAVRAVGESDGMLTLRADVDPLFHAEYDGSPDGTDEQGRLYYDVGLDAGATCGATGSGTVFDSYDFLVFDGSAFVTPREYLARALPGRTLAAWDRPINHIAPELLARVQACAQEVRRRADAMPFSRLALFAQDPVPLLEIRRTAAKQTLYEEGLGEDSIAQLAYLEVDPRAAAIEELSVEVRAISVMHCDYEGPHIELVDWKRGESEPQPLKRVGNRFLLGPAAFARQAPGFPEYTQEELRRAIAASWGQSGLATAEEAAPCAPFLRGHRLTLRRGAHVVHEVVLTYPGGC